MSGATCRSCGAPILWARSVTGRVMPVDAEPVEGGNLRLMRGTGAGGDLVATVVGSDPGILRHNAHFATCPNADQHRRRT